MMFFTHSFSKFSIFKSNLILTLINLFNINMDHVPEFWRELKLEFKDNIKKKELRKSLIEEEKEQEQNKIKTEIAHHPGKKNKKVNIVLSHCIIS